VLPEVVHDFLLRRVARAGSILALDYDGTLAPFHVDRMAAVPHPAVIPPLQRLLHEAATCVVIVSGRPVRELEALLPFSPLPELWGVHGWERRRPDGQTEVAALPLAAASALAGEEQRLHAAGAAGHVERKSAALALHWRGLTTLEALALQDLVREPWEDLRARLGFAVRPFDGGIELRHRAHDKGGALLTLLERAPADTPLAYLGDDETDEDAFRALAAPRFMERALGVRVRTAPAPTAAAAEIAPADVPDFLVAWLEAAMRAGVRAREGQAT
jgi:trehalose 6-phosphate phosphatase